jgi:AraC-like DNA-binding protein
VIAPLAVLDLFVRGAAAGAMAAWTLAICRSAVSRQAKLSTILMGLSTISWLITESGALRQAFGDLRLLVAISYPVGGLFWLFMVTVFEDRPVRPAMLAPSALLLAGGLVMGATQRPLSDWFWIGFNGFSGLLAVHVAYIILRGWGDDLVEGRRRLRAILMGLVSLFVMLQVVAGFIYRADPASPWRILSIGQIGGSAQLALLVLASSILFLQARPAIFGASRRPEPVADARGEAADRLLLAKLEAFMADGGWRREGLTIGAVAEALETPEHQLRRLINRRLGHRNFADFVNGHRVEAAKRRLADASEARTTVAAIAFDLGYGSLGPFNRAFRAATGSTPTEWRRQALSAASPILEEAV